jgi:hypothetical protein
VIAVVDAVFFVEVAAATVVLAVCEEVATEVVAEFIAAVCVDGETKDWEFIEGCWDCSKKNDAATMITKKEIGNKTFMCGMGESNPRPQFGKLMSYH